MNTLALELFGVDVSSFLFGAVAGGLVAFLVGWKWAQRHVRKAIVPRRPIP